MMRRKEWERKNKICYLFFILIFFLVADVASFSLPYVKQWSPAEGHIVYKRMVTVPLYLFIIYLPSFHIWLVSHS